MSDEKVAELRPVKVMQISELRPSPVNARKIPTRAIEVVALSLRKFGWQQPLVADSEGELIAGHTRLLAAKSLGLTKAPVIIADNLTPEEVRAYRIADNRTHDFTTWDYPALNAELDALAADFSDVLALEDWESIAADFDAQLDLPDDTKADMTGNGFEVTIVFASKEKALAAEAGLMDLDGALDVRHKLRAKPDAERERYIDRMEQLRAQEAGA
mgnify:FL=1